MEYNLIRNGQIEVKKRNLKKYKYIKHHFSK